MLAMETRKSTHSHKLGFLQQTAIDKRTYRLGQTIPNRTLDLRVELPVLYQDLVHDLAYRSTEIIHRGDRIYDRQQLQSLVDNQRCL